MKKYLILIFVAILVSCGPSASELEDNLKHGTISVNNSDTLTFSAASVSVENVVYAQSFNIVTINKHQYLMTSSYHSYKNFTHLGECRQCFIDRRIESDYILNEIRSLINNK